MNFIKKFFSRKFLVVIANVGVGWLVTNQSMDPEVAKWLVASLASVSGVYFLGQSWVDAKVNPEELEALRKNGGK